MNCPSCNRPVAMARPRCLYCGASLPAELVSAIAPPAPDPARPAPETAPASSGVKDTLPERLLLILDSSGADAAALARALALGPFEAEQRRRRGGLELLRIGDGESVAAEAARLAAEGLRVETVPEQEARARPELALGGARETGALTLRTQSGPLVVEGGELFLVVRGPIVRQYLPSPQRLRFDSAVLESGYRIHLHRRRSSRPVELDPSSFEFTQETLAGSSLLELNAWIEELAPGIPTDDHFRRLPPALAPAAEEAAGALGAAKALREPTTGGRRRREEPRRVLDNLEQFRFYSAWRAAVERRRREP